MTPVRAGIWIAVTGAFAALNFFLSSSVEERDQDVVYSYAVLGNAVLIYSLLLVFVLAITNDGNRLDVLALRAPASWWRAIGISLAAVAVILAGAAIALSLTNAGDEQNLTPEEWDPSRAGPYAASFLAIVFIGPVVEELLYRGAGIGLLLPYGTPVAVLVTALLFGAGHGLVLSFGAFLWFGIVTALVRLGTDSVYPPILVHSAFNAIGMTVPLFV